MKRSTVPTIAAIFHPVAHRTNGERSLHRFACTRIFSRMK
jgi:hypothetical protein